MEEKAEGGLKRWRERRVPVIFVFVIARHYPLSIVVDPRDTPEKKKEGSRVGAGSVISFILIAFVKPCEVLAPPLLSYYLSLS